MGGGGGLQKVSTFFVRGARFSDLSLKPSFLSFLSFFVNHLLLVDPQAARAVCPRTRHASYDLLTCN